MSVVIISSVVGGLVVGGGLVGSAVALHALEILPRNIEEARAGIRTNTMQDRLDRINDGERGADTLPHSWVCIRYSADDATWYYLDQATGQVFKSPRSRQYAPVEEFVEVRSA
ncbi:hypothetical protein Daus18300_011918 [Diaporthe australafricana]|uniref:WW domain-containing protein n=1 Tax=Diaporthe australafricana TaxID=127596 RepID=A0ABR3W5E3_9PEZI